MRLPTRCHARGTVTSSRACSPQTATGRRGLGARWQLRRRARNAADQVDMIVSNSSNPGNDIQASTNLCTRRSSFPMLHRRL